MPERRLVELMDAEGYDWDDVGQLFVPTAVGTLMGRIPLTPREAREILGDLVASDGEPLSPRGRRPAGAPPAPPVR
jgi:hypothetical protein